MIKPKFTFLELIYFALAVAGLCGTWHHNIRFYTKVADTSIGNFIALTKTT